MCFVQLLDIPNLTAQFTILIRKYFRIRKVAARSSLRSHLDLICQNAPSSRLIHVTLCFIFNKNVDLEV